VLYDGAPPPSGQRYSLGPDRELQRNRELRAPGTALEALPGLLRDAAHHAPREEADGTGAGGWKKLRFLHQLKQTFLVCEGEEGLYVLDQHAAAERVVFSRLRAAYLARNVATQALLFPLIVDITPSEAELLEVRVSDIRHLGLDVRVRGAEQASVHGVPKLLAKSSPERLLRDLLRELGRNDERSYSNAVDKVLATMACHEAVRAGDSLTSVEAEALLLALDGADFAGYCPHGRPIVAVLSWLELERKVGRR
jgi:DNA mismatch repair protein MutL